MSSGCPRCDIRVQIFIFYLLLLIRPSSELANLSCPGTRFATLANGQMLEQLDD